MDRMDHNGLHAALAMPSKADRIMSRVRIGPACWIWTGHPLTNVSSNGQTFGASATRMVWVIQRGPVPAGRQVIRRFDRCRNRLCVNPDHLRIASAGEAMRDLSRAQHADAERVRSERERNVR